MLGVGIDKGLDMVVVRQIFGQTPDLTAIIEATICTVFYAPKLGDHEIAVRIIGRITVLAIGFVCHIQGIVYGQNAIAVGIGYVNGFFGKDDLAVFIGDRNVNVHFELFFVCKHACGEKHHGHKGQ